MNRAYGPTGWKMAIKTVQVYDDARQASSVAPGNLLTCLTESEAREFLADWDSDAASRAEDDKDKLKDVGNPQLELDVENYRIRLRMKDRA